MKCHKKKFLGGFFAILIGTSCCWMSTAVVWLGSVGIFQWTTGWLTWIQFLLLLLGISLTVFMFYKILRRGG